MQKKILASIIGGLFLTGNTAMAAVDLTDADTVQTYLSSVSGASGGTSGDMDQGADCDAEVGFPVGFSINPGSSRFLKLTLTNATFDGIFKTASLSATNLGVVSISQGGADGDSEVVLEITSTATISNTATFEVDFDGALGTALDTTGDVSMSTALYADVTTLDADNPINGTTFAGPIFAFSDGVKFSSAVLLSEEIDTQDPKKFVGSTTPTVSPLADLTATLVACNDDGVITNTSVVAKLTVTSTGGGFDAFTGGAADVDLADSSCASNYLAETIDDTNDEAVFNDTVTGGAADPTSPALITVAEKRLCVTPDTTTEMTSASYECTLDVSGAGFASPVTLGPIACGQIQFAGSSDRVAYGLQPGGAYKQYFRISNPSTTEGDVAITLTNDDGESVRFPLGDVTNIKGALETTNMPAGSSTELLFSDDLYAAAQASDGTFLHNSGKLRVIVRGNFGDDMDNGAGATGSSALQTFGDANSSDGIILEAVAVGKKGEIVIME